MYIYHCYYPSLYNNKRNNIGSINGRSNNYKYNRTTKTVSK